MNILKKILNTDRGHIVETEYFVTVNSPIKENKGPWFHAMSTPTPHDRE